MNTKRVGQLGLSDEEEEALVSFMQVLTDGSCNAIRSDRRSRAEACVL